MIDIAEDSKFKELRSIDIDKHLNKFYSAAEVGIISTSVEITHLNRLHSDLWQLETRLFPRKLPKLTE